MRVRGTGVVVVLAVLLPGAGLADSGIFRSAFIDTLGGSPTAIGVGDFNADGLLDVVATQVGGGSGEVTLSRGMGVCRGGVDEGRTCWAGSPCEVPDDCVGDGTVSRSSKTFSVGSFPAGLLVADLDADGLDDLMVANANDGSVVFLKGLGNSDYFAPAGPPIAVGATPRGIAMGDLDEDGKTDLAVANEGEADTLPGSVSVLRGQGDGSFTLILQPNPEEPEEEPGEPGLPAELGTRAVAIGDIDGDEHLDILALNSRANSISIFLGVGDGTFSVSTPLHTGSAPLGLALAHLNEDDSWDVITADNNDDAVAVYLGTGDGGFGARRSFSVGIAPNALVLGEVNGDGHVDVVASNVRSSDVTVLRGDGTGALGGGRTFVADLEPQALALGDFDGDDLMDLAVATEGAKGPSLAILRNRGDGSLYGVEDVPAGIAPPAVVAADVDDDALPDLILSSDGGDLVVLRSLADGGFHPAELLSIGGRTSGIVAVDLNGDTLIDMAVADIENDQVVVVHGLGGGAFGPLQGFATAEEPAAITSGDFNGDGRPDLAVTAIEAQRVSVLLQQTDGTFAAGQGGPVQETPVGVASIDANCDGLDDLIVANNASNTVQIMLSNGEGAFDVAQTLPELQVGQGPSGIAVADFDRDGVEDFAVSNTVVPVNSHSVRVFLGDCSATFAINSAVRAGELVAALIARDFTGDGIVDLAAANRTANSLGVLAGYGNGGFSAPRPDGVSRQPVAIAAADFDADGGYDAATANNDQNANNTSVLMNCAREEECDPFRPPLPGTNAVRGDGNGDGLRTAADCIAVAAEVMDGDGRRSEDIDIGIGSYVASKGVDANGDGRVDPQDRTAVVRYIFKGA